MGISIMVLCVVLSLGDSADKIDAPSVVKLITPAEVLLVAEEVQRGIVANVNDYTGLLVKREYTGGKNTGYQYIKFKFREQPLGIYLKFIPKDPNPPSLWNREVVYNEKDGLIVKRGGSRNASMTLAIATDSPLATEGNRYLITDMGLRTLSARLLERIKVEANIPDTEIKVYDEAKVDGRSVRFYRMIHNKKSSAEQCYIAEIAVDKELHIPIYYKALGYGVGDEPVVLEEYSFRNIKLNVGLTDKDFSEKNSEYGFKKNKE
jgi:hypothetical protein